MKLAGSSITSRALRLVASHSLTDAYNLMQIQLGLPLCACFLIGRLSPACKQLNASNSTWLGWLTAVQKLMKRKTIRCCYDTHMALELNSVRQAHPCGPGRSDRGTSIPFQTPPREWVVAECSVYTSLWASHPGRHVSKYNLLHH